MMIPASPGSRESVNQPTHEPQQENAIVEDEPVSKLISVGIDAGDVKKLQDAGFSSCRLILLTKMNFPHVEGLSEAKVDKIIKATEKLVEFGYITPNDTLPSNVQDELQIVEFLATLRNHVLLTYDPDPRVRRDALMDIQNLLHIVPSKVKPHTCVVAQTVMDHILDEHGPVRKLSYQVFDLAISNDLKEEDQHMIIKVLLQFILKTTRHPIIDVRFMALNLLDLVLRFSPPFSPSDALEIISVYIDFLQSTYAMRDKRSLADALKGLEGCLSLMPWIKKGCQDTKETDDYLLSCYGFSCVIDKLKFLFQLLVYHFQTFLHLYKESLDEDSFDHLASLLRCINLTVVSFTQSKYKNSVYGQDIVVMDGNVSTYVNMLFKLFPVHSLKQPPVKEDNDRLLDINLVIANTFFEFNRWIPIVEWLKAFLDFIEDVLCGKFCAPGESNNVWETHFAQLIHFVPTLVCYGAESATNNRPSRLLRAFTHIFTESKLRSLLKSACLFAINDMVLLMHTRFLSSESNSQQKTEYIYAVQAWMREILHWCCLDINHCTIFWLE